MERDHILDDLLSDAALVDLSRALGDDYAKYGVNLPDDPSDALIEGYQAGKQRYRKPKHPPDRFIKKWLQIRNSALSRGRAVSSGLTIDVLKTLDVSRCPVSLVLLTYGTLGPSDWSVDRMNNNGAYALGNLAIISTGVNKAKGIKSIHEVRTLSEGAATVDGLTPKQWARVAALMYGPWVVEYPEDKWPVRQVARMPELSFRAAEQTFQDVLVRYATSPVKRIRDDKAVFLQRLPNHELRRKARGLMNAISERAPSLESPYDVWFDDGLFGKYQGFYGSLYGATAGMTTSVLGDSYRNFGLPEHILTELQFPKRGYLN